MIFPLFQHAFPADSAPAIVQRSEHSVYMRRRPATACVLYSPHDGDSNEEEIKANKNFFPTLVASVVLFCVCIYREIYVYICGAGEECGCCGATEGEGEGGRQQQPVMEGEGVMERKGGRRGREGRERVVAEDSGGGGIREGKAREAYAIVGARYPW